MPTSLPKWAQGTIASAMKSAPLPAPVLPPIGGSQAKAAGAPATLPGPASRTQVAAIRNAAAATSHNVFRPDIYRVSEGYLN